MGSKLGAFSNIACLATLKDKGLANVTVHGSHCNFRDCMSESTIYRLYVAERALAHFIQDKSEAAY